MTEYTANARLGGRLMVTVTLDAFSGLPSLSRTLSAADVAELHRRIAALPPAAESVVLPFLGYRGVIVDGESAAFAGPWIVHRGTVTGAAGVRADTDRAFEMWLLDTADAPLDPDVRDTVN